MRLFFDDESRSPKQNGGKPTVKSIEAIEAED